MSLELIHQEILEKIHNASSVEGLAIYGANRELYDNTPYGEMPEKGLLGCRLEIIRAIEEKHGFDRNSLPPPPVSTGIYRSNQVLDYTIECYAKKLGLVEVCEDYDVEKLKVFD